MTSVRESFGREQSSGSVAPADVGRRYAIEGDGFQGDSDQVIIGLPPVPPDAPAARLSRAEGVRYLVQVLLMTLVVGLVAEVAATLAIPQWPARTLEISGPEDAILLAKAGARRGPYILLLGDSVMRDGALKRVIGRDAIDSTIPQFIRARAAKDLPAASVVDLSMEGALVNDFAGLLQLVTDRGLTPSAVVVQLDYRVLSPVHDDEQNLSRRWLGASPEPIERPIDNAVRRLLLSSNAFLLMRGSRQAGGRWLTDGTQSVVNRLEGGPRGTVDADRNADVLRLTVGRFYRSDRAVARSRMLIDLLRLVDTLVERRIPVLLAVTPTNAEFLGDQIDVPMYRANIAAVESAVDERYGGASGVRFVHIDGDIPPRLFLDHVHLRPDGNRMIAERLVDNLDILLHDASR